MSTIVEVGKFVAKMSACVVLLTGIHDPFSKPIPTAYIPPITPAFNAAAPASTTSSTSAPAKTSTTMAQGFKAPIGGVGAYPKQPAKTLEMVEPEDEFEDEDEDDDE